jgi:LacI family transcriptional regulator
MLISKEKLYKKNCRFKRLSISLIHILNLTFVITIDWADLMQKRVSLKDIANKVGVSIALVSYVLNGQEKEKRVGTEVVKKIRLAAEELNYQPNQIARSLRLKSTKTIGLIVADIANPFFGQLARIIENEANKFGYTVIFGSSDEDGQKSDALINTLLNRQVDGFIIVPTEDTISQIRNLIRKKIPVVLVDRYFPEISTSYVVLDNYLATFDATSHLIDKGYKEIVMVAYKSALVHMKERIRGYAEAMIANNLSGYQRVAEIRIDHYQADIENVYNTFIVNGNKNMALIFATNALSVSGLYCSQDKCIKIPDDVAFIGFDGGECFDLYNPPLSFIQQPLEEMGKESFRVLLDLMKGSSKISQIILSPNLIVRDLREC